ncbi:MAG: hypothetical protein ABEI06_06050, partial [Halobacteriaceae archaeon]
GAKHRTQIHPEPAHVWCWWGNPSPCPAVGNRERERRLLAFHSLVDRPRVHRQTSASDRGG